MIAMHSRIRVVPALVAWSLVLVVSLPAAAQPTSPSGRQTSFDGSQVLVNRPEAGLQWAISLDPTLGTITGNVFDPQGGPPSFVACDRLGDDGTLDPSDVRIEFDCAGTSQCDAAPCSPEGWDGLGVVTLPGRFFQPARDPFATTQQPGVLCDPIRVGPVDEFPGQPSFEIDTSVCPYATAMQRIGSAVSANEDIFIRIWNFPLEVPRNGRARIGFQLGEEFLWGDEFTLPRPSGLFGPFGVGPTGVGICVRPRQDHPAGTPIYVNLQFFEPDSTSRASTQVSTAPDLGRPLHSTPGVVHILEFTAGSNCEGEPAGRRLVNSEGWELVSLQARE
jgi:hypothetical protein